MADYILPPDFVYGRIVDGDGFIVPKLFTVPADGSTNIHIRNPHEDKVMWLAAMNLDVEGIQEFYLHDDFNSITDGSQITIQNALMDSENGGVDEGPFEAYYDSTYDAKTTYPLGFTSGDKKSVSHIEVIATAMQPDRQAVVEIRNQENTQRKGYFAALVLTSY